MRRIIGLAIAIGFLVLSFSAAAETPRRPLVAGPWMDLLEPTVSGKYINDHCVYQDKEGNWTLMGITGEKPSIGLNEKFFIRGVTPSLSEPMRDMGPLFKGFPDKGVKWAPHAVWDGNTLHAFFGPGKIRHLVSSDGREFEYAGVAVKDRYRWLRDTMALKADDKWIMYATDRVDKKDVVSAWTSRDLYNWEKAGVVFTALRPAHVYGKYVANSACESPFVMARDGGYYLSVCLTNYPLDKDPGVYLDTVVFYSADPLDFGVFKGGQADETARLVGRIEAHAPEYILDGDGNWWITTCGWTDFPRPAGCPGGKACIAPLSWEEIE